MLEDYFFTKNTKWILWGSSGVILAALIFHAGVVVGSHQTVHGRISFEGGPGGPSSGGMMQNFMPREGYVESGHGAIGSIATITPPTFIIETRDGLTQKIVMSSSTVITGNSGPTAAALQSGQLVIVIGDPNDSDDVGFLDARIVHILPAKPNH